MDVIAKNIIYYPFGLRFPGFLVRYELNRIICTLQFPSCGQTGEITFQWELWIYN